MFVTNEKLGSIGRQLYTNKNMVQDKELMYKYNYMETIRLKMH